MAHSAERASVATLRLHSNRWASGGEANPFCPNDLLLGVLSCCRHNTAIAPGAARMAKLRIYVLLFVLFYFPHHRKKRFAEYRREMTYLIA
jgi:hypothetical protein